MIRMELNLGRFLLALSTWLDWSADGLNAHQRRVACASAAMAAHVGADPAIVERTFAAAVIHDLGAVKNAERLDLQRFDVEHTLPHCLRGAQMVAEASV
ncbi:MAG: hypothetical protein WBK10_09545, partial [Bacillota bacterium]